VLFCAYPQREIDREPTPGEFWLLCECLVLEQTRENRKKGAWTVVFVGVAGLFKLTFICSVNSHIFTVTLPTQYPPTIQLPAADIHRHSHMLIICGLSRTVNLCLLSATSGVNCVSNIAEKDSGASWPEVVFLVLFMQIYLI
jgi:hypothetical protein